MKENVSVGIVGNGFVGNAVYQNLRDKARCTVYDLDKNRSISSLEEVIQRDFINPSNSGSLEKNVTSSTVFKFSR